MHELSLAGGVVNTALRHAGGQTVTVVSLRVGHMRQVVPDSLRFCFEIVARDTACEGAELRMTEVEVTLECRDCEHGWSPQGPAFRCPDCGSAAVTVTGGEELLIEYIEVEDKEDACTARG
ncbi:MAG: hydrogenase maturation nickel metallochaperone HypA [Solirubrobacteraceae bacterium]